MTSLSLYDPLTYDNLMIGLIVHFEKQPIVRITTIERVDGPGIYALYYDGQHDVYKAISGNSKPIYVGKADPPGKRMGAAVDVSVRALQSRISQHARSLEAAEDLDIDDFQCRYLAVVPVWIGLAERFLIDNYKPVWNRCLEGFGNHDPGKGRRQGEISWWDALHPGREWARELRQVKTKEAARKLVEQFFTPGGE